MKYMAIRYFEGTITPEEAKDLSEWIDSDENHLRVFRVWEKEWSESHTMSDAANKAFQRFTQQTDRTTAQPHTIIKKWKSVAAAAAVVLLMAGSGLAVWQWTQSQPTTYYTCKVPYGSKSCIELPDGTVVWLNAGSTLRYSSKFNEKNREVELDGEGYFDVTKQNGKTFVVKTAACDVTVKGTRFDVSSYADDDAVSVSLMEGSVQVNTPSGEKNIKPGEKVIVDKQTGEITQTHYEKSANTWIDNNLDYEAISLKDLAKILSRQFNVNIQIQSQRLAEMRFSVILKQKETIGDVMQSLQTIQPMKVEKRDKTLYIFE